MDNSKKIADLQAQIEELRLQQAAFDAQGPDEKFATELHDLMCRFNHDDQCSWLYEFYNGLPDWNGGDHNRWLRKAREARKLFPAWADSAIIEIVRKVKNL